MHETPDPDRVATKAVAEAPSSVHSQEFVIEPIGPFSWDAETDILANFPPTQHFWRGTSEVVRLAFPLDGNFVPVAVALRFTDGILHDGVVGTDRVDLVRHQVTRIFSLDQDGTDYPQVGQRDPQVGELMDRLPCLRPVLFTSPYETAAWAIISQRIIPSQAARIKKWLIAEHGTQFAVAEAVVGCFPTPEQLLAVTAVPSLAPEKLLRLHGIAVAAPAGQLDAQRLRELGDDAGIDRAISTFSHVGLLSLASRGQARTDSGSVGSRKCDSPGNQIRLERIGDPTEHHVDLDQESLNVDRLLHPVADSVSNGIVECANASQRNQPRAMARRKEPGQIRSSLR